MTKKNLLVTIADESYVDAAKQVFSGAYFNAGWKGAYMLLSYKIPEEKLEWFRDKGILVKKYEPLVDEKKFGRWFSVALSRFYLFKMEFKKWNRIIYIDGDIIIRASLDDLLKVNDFAAVDGVYPFRTLFSKNMSEKGCKFNSGLFVFDTKIVTKTTFLDLTKTLKNYSIYALKADESILNLFFYKKWQKLPFYYNVYVSEFFKMLYKFNIIKINGIMIHFPTNGVFDNHKPWNKTNPFYKEWKFNFDRADEINIKKYYDNYKVFTYSEKKYWQNYYRKLYSLWKIEIFFDKVFIRPITIYLNFLGKIGIFLKKNFPNIYYNLKGVKNENINYKL